MSGEHDDLLQQLQRLAPDERARLLAALGITPTVDLTPTVDQGEQQGGNGAGANNTYEKETQIGDRVEGPQLRDLQAQRDAFVATQQTISIYFGTQPVQERASLLNDYLAQFAEECEQLGLQRIAGRRQRGNQQQAAPPLRLQDVYTNLTTDGSPITRLQTTTTVERLRRLMKKLERRSPANATPERVLEISNTKDEQGSHYWQMDQQRLRAFTEHFDGKQLPEDAEITWALTRPELVIEAIHKHPRLVLLGEPGSGKSTVLRYLGRALARRACGLPERLTGWDASDTPIPILLPLAQVAETLTKIDDPDKALWQTLGAILDGPQGLSEGLLGSLREALRRGGVILLCDGLDELSAEGGERSPRVVVSLALQRLIKRTKARAVITSRVLPYRAAEGWQLPPQDWQERTIQPLAFGQVRGFVLAWYQALAQRDSTLSRKQASQRAEDLIEELQRRPALEPLHRTPLLLTMLALLHDNDRVPEDEVTLYEQCVGLLLERWEPVRTESVKRPGLIERLGSPLGLTLARLRDPLHALAYEAHHDATGEEGRGVISRDVLRGKLSHFFERMRITDVQNACKTFEYVLNEEAGLLMARGDNAFVFPHLSFQEYLAACYLASRPTSVEAGDTQPTMRELAYNAWCGTDRERWRKVLVLLAGRLAVSTTAATEGLLWLKQLWGSKRGAQPKVAEQHRQDVRLAALTYRSLGGRVPFASGDLDLEHELEQPLRLAIAVLLNTADSTIPLQDRLLAAEVLGELGDPRFPQSDEQWQAEWQRRGSTLRADGDHYWRFVPGGRYQIGGWEEGEASAELELAQPFWIARLPITVAQFIRFITAGGYQQQQWWTSEGWKYHQDDEQPRYWGRVGHHEPNQPVTIITWYEATAYCAWLSAQLSTSLPTGYVLRLPSEAEWEVGAAYAGPGERRLYPWGSEEPTAERAIYDEVGRDTATPVGCCPAGAAACGALDMAGNVWEWTSSPHRAYPEEAHLYQKDFTINEWNVPLRGGSYYANSTNVRCGARGRYYPDYWDDDDGFRVIVAPRLAHLS